MQQVNNRIRIEPELREIVLKSELYYRGKHLCAAIDDKVTSSRDESMAIINAS